MIIVSYIGDYIDLLAKNKMAQYAENNPLDDLSYKVKKLLSSYDNQSVVEESYFNGSAKIGSIEFSNKVVIKSKNLSNTLFTTIDNRSKLINIVIYTDNGFSIKKRVQITNLESFFYRLSLLSGKYEYNTPIITIK